MGRKSERQVRRQKSLLTIAQYEQEVPPKPPIKRAKEPISAMTEAQAHYILSIEQNQLTFGTGPAGTGKTYVAGALAAEALAERETDKVIITRPAVEAGESLGFLPGELEEKFDPYFQPFRDVLEERLGASFVEYLIKIGRIEALPLAYMRGKTFKNCWVVLDEAQNTTPVQMKLFLTRIGKNSKIIVNGDTTQKDIRGESGLVDAIERLEGLKSVGFVEFGREDIVRSGLVQDIVDRYESY